MSGLNPKSQYANRIKKITILPGNGGISTVKFIKGGNDYCLLIIWKIATTRVQKAHLYQAYKHCVIKAIPSQTYGNIWFVMGLL